MPEIKSPIYRQTFVMGKGAIEPASHVANGEYDWDLVDSMEADVANDDSLYEEITLSVPIQCADGRTAWVVGASAIGGSFSTVIADALGSRKYYDSDISAKDHALVVYDRLSAQSLPIGGHDDDSAKDENCGCGGEDKLGSVDRNSLSVLGFLSNYGDQVRDLIEGLVDSRTGRSLGLVIPDDQHKLIVSNGSELFERCFGKKQYASCGKDLRDAMQAKNGRIETLHGPHKEIILGIDFRPDRVLNRPKLSARYGSLAQAFYVNVAGLKNAAKALYDEGYARELSFNSALYYNVAATAVLAGPSLRVVTLT